MVGKGLQVLHDSCEVELVARAGEAPEAQALKAMMGLQVRKSHLDPVRSKNSSGAPPPFTLPSDGNNATASRNTRFQAAC
jgi:hypothetical protein